MKQHRMWLLIPAALVLGASANAEPQPVVAPPPVLGEQLDDAPPDPACADLIRQALARDAQREFTLAGMLNRSPLPLGGHRASAPALQMDGTARSLFVNCETRQAYVSKRGGVIDITYWYGPFGL